MAQTALPTPEELRKLLRYEPDTGKLYWLERTLDLFRDGKQSAEHNCAAWNGRFANKEAFTAVHGEGYRQGTIFSRVYFAHRVIWAMVHGAWPADQLDHINGVRDDNRIKNLRAVTNQENGRNKKLPSDNTSGVMGVGWHKPACKWAAQINVSGRCVYLGVFTKKDDAIAARKAAEVKFGFHENHGRV